MSSSTSKKGRHNGAWLGSDICDGHIEALRQRRLLPPASVVAARVPGPENSLTPREGEVVIFDEHFYRGFGLPASNFFSNFLIFFGMHPHHVVPNAILQLAAYVVLCEGFLGIEPRLDLGQNRFFFKQQSIKMDKAEAEKLTAPRSVTPCGATLVHHRTTCGFPQMPLQDSIKLWQRGFLYVKNVDPSHDGLNLPPFVIAPSTERRNWKASYPKPIAVVDIGNVECALTTESIWPNGSEEALESEGSEPPGEHLKPSLLDWTDDDATPPTPPHAAFGEDPYDLEEVTSPPLTRGRCKAGETARNKGKEASTSKPAPKHASTGPPAGGHGGDAKKHGAGAGRKRVPVVAGEAEDMEEETTSAAEIAGWAAADAAKKALEDVSALCWQAAANKTAVGQSKPT
ncbi:hypothetical protein D1007_37154 [Hordeum vulgare]|nr:hypothetical protein D1007_37154 [Hordeum vulgare]